MLDSKVISTIGIYLTLTGLLGTFFYVHLSNWLRDLFRLHAKWENNHLLTDDGQKSAIRECRFEIKGLFNHVPLLTTLVISGFIWLLFSNAKELLSGASSDVLASQIFEMLSVFIWIFYLLAGYFLIHGYFLGISINKQLKPTKIVSVGKKDQKRGKSLNKD